MIDLGRKGRNSDGGRLVTSADLLHSDLLEVVQVYGMNPELFAPDKLYTTISILF